MKFDELIEKLLNNEDYAAYGLSVDDVITLIEDLRLEYAPTVEMTKVGKNYLLYYLENSSFGSFISDINLVRSGTIGVKSTDYFEYLSDEDLMQAWLHPETIKIIGDENE